ncbi:MAG: internal scaffolding protein [Arizlama microvirus]|nr:MAG: internal scaffolding protein [Arizlama microvirus]
MITAKHQYDERLPLASDLSFVGDKGVTKQSDAKDCDINSIFKKYERSGQLPDMIVRDGRYGDFSEVPDYQDALNIVKTAEDQFKALDVDVRNRFGNDPAAFLAFATDPRNVDELGRMGLLKPEAIAARKATLDAEILARNDAAKDAAKAALAAAK